MYMNKKPYFQILRHAAVAGLLLLPRALYAQDVSGDTGFSLDLNAPAGDSGGFAIEVICNVFNVSA